MKKNIQRNTFILMTSCLFILTAILPISDSRITSYNHGEEQQDVSNQFTYTQLNGLVTRLQKNETTRVVTAQAIYLRYFTVDWAGFIRFGFIHSLAEISFVDGLLLHIFKIPRLDLYWLKGIILGELQ